MLASIFVRSAIAAAIVLGVTAAGPAASAGPLLPERGGASGAMLTATGCPPAITGTTPTVPGRVSAKGVVGTTTVDLAAFAKRFNAIRVANCLPPVPYRNFRYNACMETRLFWMAEDPSTNPLSAWGHIGSKRSDGVRSVGCDGNLAGGPGVTGATVADRWWASTSHRASLYKPSIRTSMANTCILFAMTHGGIPNEPYSFTRAAARWVTCP